MPSKRTSPKLLHLEGLRGIASFIVVISHLRLTFFASSHRDIKSSLEWMPHVLARPLLAVIESLYNGTFAVWLFWILSAFVLSLQFFLRTRNAIGPSSHDYLEDAILRRYPRLVLPVVASVVFAYSIHLLGLMHNIVLANTLGEPYASGWLSRWYRFSPNMWHAFKSATWDTFFAFDSRFTYNPVLWTLTKELFGSLFLFAFLGTLGHSRSRLLAYPITLAVLYALQMHWLNAFVAGIAMCDIYVSSEVYSPLQRIVKSSIYIQARQSIVIGTVAWLILLIGVGQRNYFAVSYLFVGTAMVALTLLSSGTQRVLSSRLPVFLGKISFGLYLVHFPLICSFSCWAYLATYLRIGATPAAVLVSVITCLLSVALGYLLYVLADRPGMVASRRISALMVGVKRPPS